MHRAMQPIETSVEGRGLICYKPSQVVRKRGGNGNATLYFRVRRRTAATANMVHTGRKMYKSTCQHFVASSLVRIC